MPVALCNALSTVQTFVVRHGVAASSRHQRCFCFRRSVLEDQLRLIDHQLETFR